MKPLNREGDAFQYLKEKLPEMADAKLQDGFFKGPQIRPLFKDNTFKTKLNKMDEKAWKCMGQVPRECAS